MSNTILESHKLKNRQVVHSRVTKMLILERFPFQVRLNLLLVCPVTWKRGTWEGCNSSMQLWGTWKRETKKVYSQNKSCDRNKISSNWLKFSSACSQIKKLLWTSQIQNTTVAQTQTQKAVIQINTDICLMSIHTSYMCVTEQQVVLIVGNAGPSVTKELCVLANFFFGHLSRHDWECGDWFSACSL